MKDQQYIAEQFVGKSFSDKLNGEMAKYFIQRKFETLGYIPRPGAVAMVHTLDEDGILMGVAGSDPFDIINDNFGKLLAAHFCIPATTFNDIRCALGGGGLANPPVADTGVPTASSVFAYNQSNGAWCAKNTSSGISFMQIGSGVTAPEVDDFNVETAFANGGIEDGKVQVTGGSAYQPSIGRIAVPCNIGPTTGSGTINELCLFTIMADIGGVNGTNRFYLMSHDTISPGLVFITGQTIFAQYFFQI